MKQFSVRILGGLFVLLPLLSTGAAGVDDTYLIDDRTDRLRPGAQELKRMLPDLEIRRF